MLSAPPQAIFQTIDRSEPREAAIESSHRDARYSCLTFQAQVHVQGQDQVKCKKHRFHSLSVRSARLTAKNLNSPKMLFYV